MQLDDVGEVLVEVGGACGWGPHGPLSPDQLASILGRLTDTAAQKGAVATVVRTLQRAHGSSSHSGGVRAWEVRFEAQAFVQAGGGSMWSA